MSADGRYVAFTSGASNLVPGDTNGTPDVFVREIGVGEPVGGTTELAVVGLDAAAAKDGSSTPGPLAMAGLAAAGALLLVIGAWHARRRWLR